MTSYQDLVSAIAAQNTVEQSLMVMIDGLVQQLKDAKASNDSTQMDMLLASIQANTKILSDAVMANTQSAPEEQVV